MLSECALLAVCAVLVPHVAFAVGDGASQTSKEVTFKVAAMDANGHPLLDLTAADFKVFDNGKRQQISSFKVPGTQSAPESPRPAILVLFDLLNADPERREYESQLIVRALEPLQAGDQVSLAILTNTVTFSPSAVHSQGKWGRA